MLLPLMFLVIFLKDLNHTCQLSRFYQEYSDFQVPKYNPESLDFAQKNLRQIRVKTFLGVKVCLYRTRPRKRLGGVREGMA